MNRADGPSAVERVEAVVAELRAMADRDTLEAMGPRYGIHTEHALGVPMKRMKNLAKQLGTDHELAMRLWNTRWYEARVVASLVDDPEAITAEQMDEWAEDFDNWAIVDTVCFNLFDRTSHRWDKVDEWTQHEGEFVKRAGFALIWSLTGHDPDATDDQFVHALRLIEDQAGDGRHLVDKAIGMALRAIGTRRPSLTSEAVDVANRLAARDDKAARTVGRTALRALT